MKRKKEVSMNDKKIKLSPHFTLDEMVYSDTAIRNDIKNIPKSHQISNLITLCRNVLEPIRAHYKRPWNKHWINVTSGFRCAELNKKIGGSRYSQHKKGEAADFVVNQKDVHEVWRWIVTKSDIDFHQCILEFGRWIHISYKRDSLGNGVNKNRITIATKQNNRTVYKHYTKEDILNNSYRS